MDKGEMFSDLAIFYGAGHATICDKKTLTKMRGLWKICPGLARQWQESLKRRWVPFSRRHFFIHGFCKSVTNKYLRLN